MSTNFNELIEKSKELSKKKFLDFAKAIYNIDESVFDHLWTIPIIASYAGDALISTTLSTKGEDDILDILDNAIAEHLGNSEATFISFESLSEKFDDNEIEEYRQKINNNELTEDFNAFITYNESALKKQFKELIQKNDKNAYKLNLEELEKNFIEYAAKIFTHEICHLNANTLQMTLTPFPEAEEIDYDMYYKEKLIDFNSKDIKDGTLPPKGYYTTEELNGAEEPHEEIINDKKQFSDLKNPYSNENEVLLETFSDMIFAYKEGDNIEDCLLKVLNDKNLFTGIKQNIVLKVRIVMSLFPEEISKWVMFGAYDDIRSNLLVKKILSIFGKSHSNLINTDIIRKTQEYCSSIKYSNLSPKQIEMLETLGIRIPSLITQKDMRDVATSKEALEHLGPSLADIKNNLSKEDHIEL